MSSGGQANIERLSGLPDAGFAADVIVDGRYKRYSGPCSIRITAQTGDVIYQPRMNLGQVFAIETGEGSIQLITESGRIVGAWTGENYQGIHSAALSMD
jgi:hypothetical protein